MSYRTSRLNEAVELIYKLGEGFNENKKGQTSIKTDLSSLVGLYAIYKPVVHQAARHTRASGGHRRRAIEKIFFA